MQKSFIEGDELAGFNQDRCILADAGAAQQFAESCKSRIIRMYKEWYEQLCVGQLCGHTLLDNGAKQSGFDVAQMIEVIPYVAII